MEIRDWPDVVQVCNCAPVVGIAVIISHHVVYYCRDGSGRYICCRARQI